MSIASDVVASARRTLQDYDADRFSDADLLKWVNGARRALAVAMPQAYTVDHLFTLVAGARQTLPANTAVFNDISRTEAGTPVTIVEREVLDAFSPGWRTAAAGPTAHFMYDERDRFVFDVYPPAVAGAKVYMSYSPSPTDLVLGGALNATEDLLRDALADYTVGRALLDDAQSPTNERRAVVHLRAFAGATGANFNSVLASSPNVANDGGKMPRMSPKVAT
jgi:hypothetical protein